MKNVIRSISVSTTRLDPGEAEVRLAVGAAHTTDGTELRGRLVGPRCHYASTVQVAYPLRPLAGVTAGELATRVTIPEPSLWEPENPFLYEGTLELWQDGERCERAVIHHGLRHVQLGPRGLVLNGHRFLIRAIEFLDSNEDLLALHRSGTNTLVAADAVSGVELLERADRFGFFLLLRSAESAIDAQRIAEYLQHPCFLGQICASGIPSGKVQSGGLVGVELQHSSTFTPIPGVHFAVGDRAMSDLPLPRLLRVPRAPQGNDCAEANLGWIETGNT